MPNDSTVQPADANTTDAGLPDALSPDAATASTIELRSPMVGNACQVGADWTIDRPAFANRTAQSGLIEMGAGVGAASGMSLTVADIDQDGLADVYAHQVANNPIGDNPIPRDDFSDGGQRYTWLLRNLGNLRFDDVTQTSNFTQRRYELDGVTARRVGVVVWADVDNDGDIDAFSATRTNDGVSGEAQEILLNDGSGNFELADTPASPALHAPGESLFPFAATFLDANRDGRIDLFLGLHSQTETEDSQIDRLFLQGNDGHFENVSANVGLMTGTRSSDALLNAGGSHARSWATLACDLNNDGNQELLVSSYGRSPNLLWESALQSGTLMYWNRSVASGYAFDERMDWTVDNSARCYCSFNRDAEDCATVPEPVEGFNCDEGRLTENGYFRWRHDRHRQPAYLGGNSGTTVCADFDGDGRMDLLTNEIVHWDVGEVSDPSEILYNEGGDTISFRRPGNQQTGLVRPRTSSFWDDGDMNSAVLDFDNDGRPDILVGSGSYRGTRAHLFHQKQDGTFEYVPIETGIDMRSNIGIASADFDRDGDVDLMLGHSVARCTEPGPDGCYEASHLRLFENTVGAENNWIQIELEGGPTSNRMAIGARVEVRTAESDRIQVQQVGGGHGRSGLQQDRVLHFGLGASCEADVTVRWPDATLSRDHVVLKAGYRYRIRQGQDVIALSAP